MLKWRDAARPCLCLQLLSKTLRGINISRSANVCVYFCAPVPGGGRVENTAIVSAGGRWTGLQARPVAFLLY